MSSEKKEKENGFIYRAGRPLLAVLCLLFLVRIFVNRMQTVITTNANAWSVAMQFGSHLRCNYAHGL
jgi:hypothetical protein